MLDELRREFPGEVPANAEQLELAKEDVEGILEVTFFTGANLALDWLKRKNVTPGEAQRWAKCTRIVYWQWLKTVNAGVVVHLALTAGILLNKPKLEAGNGSKQQG